jgi:DNA mismatch repair protein MSH2
MHFANLLCCAVCAVLCCCCCCSCCQVEHPLGSSCLQPLARHTGLLRDTDSFGCYSLAFGSLSAFMRLDSAAAAAINLFPRPDDPSPHGSLFGILNRCKTKMGTRLLERWLRQPLLDCEAIERRLDMVQLLKDSTMARNGLTDSALKGGWMVGGVL